MTSVGDYDLETQIGAGGSGTVWRAHHRGPVARVVALKRLRAGSGSAEVARIRREATVLTELDHPHIVRVLEVIHDGDGVALAMQYAPGGSLDDLLAERGRLTPGQVVAVVAPVADALASAHRRGVLHGDVKPANVLFTSDGEPLLTDFGVARTLGQLTSDQVSGTAEYLAPEVLDGATPDPRADVYALGIICYQALSGRVPYTGPAPLAVARAADAGVHEPLDAVPDVPGPLAAVVEQAMHRDPAARFADAETLAWALRTAVPAGEIRVPGPAATRRPRDGDGSGGETRTFGPRPPRPAAEEPARSRRLPVLALALVVAIVAAVGIRALVGDDGDERDDGDDCAEPVPPVGPGEVVEGDVTGDGCPVAGRYGSRSVDDGAVTLMVLTIPLDGGLKQIVLGDEGDQVVLGDWDCDGTDTPGLYRTASGAIEYFDVWPVVSDREYRADETAAAEPGGTARLDESDGGSDGGSGGESGGEVCDRIAVSAADGEVVGGAIGRVSDPRPAHGAPSAIMGGLVIP